MIICVRHEIGLAPIECQFSDISPFMRKYHWQQYWNQLGIPRLVTYNDGSQRMYTRSEIWVRNQDFLYCIAHVA